MLCAGSRGHCSSSCRCTAPPTSTSPSRCAGFVALQQWRIVASLLCWQSAAAKLCSIALKACHNFRNQHDSGCTAAQTTFDMYSSTCVSSGGGGGLSSGAKAGVAIAAVVMLAIVSGRRLVLLLLAARLVQGADENGEVRFLVCTSGERCCNCVE